MQTPDKRLAGPVPKDEPAPAKPFAGRSALINGLIDAHKEEAPASGGNMPVSNLPQFVPVGRESVQIIESRRIFETVLDIVNAKNAMANYQEELGRQAKAVVARKSDVLVTEELQMAVISPSGKPATMRDALVLAMAELGLRGSIVAEKEGSGRALFTVECNGEKSLVPINSSVMGSDNPIEGVKKVLAFLSIGQTDDDRRERSLKARRTSRPPPTPLGIGSDELDGRMVTFDGKLEHGSESKWIFTYIVKGMETSFSFGTDAKGQDLLEMIDERIDMLHRQYGKPYPAQVLEWRSRERAGRRYMEGIPENATGIACALDYLADCPLAMRDLVPPEYLEAFDALKKIPHPRPAFLTANDLNALKAALDMLDHPISAIIRETFGKNETMLDRKTQEEVRALLQLAPTVSVDICDAALCVICDAHSLISRDNWAALSTRADLREGYFGMMYQVRKAISDAIADGTLEIDR